MELGLRGRTAIVCGGSAGIGLGCAEALAEAGANLVLFARGRETLEREAARLGAVPVAGDVRNPDDLARLVDTAVERFGGVDVLVLNSGGPPRTGSFEFSDEQLEDAVELLLLSSIRLVRLCLPHLEASGRGRVIAITSSAVKEPIDTLALSSAVRPGLVGWLKTASRELGPKGITVNSVAPGRIDTERIREVYPDGPSEADLATIPLAPPRHAARDRRRRLLPRLRPRLVRDRRGDRRRRRPDPGHAVKLGRLVVGGLSSARSPSARSGSLPSDSYLLLPDTAKPLADKVEVEGEKPHPPGAIYYVDVVVREASLLEELAAAARPDGADIVPEQALVPPGSNFGERRRQNLQAMDRSQQVAAAVALRELGYDVKAKSEGALVVGSRFRRAGGREAPADRRDRRGRRRGRPDAGRPAPADREAQAGRDGPPARPARRRDEGDRGRHDREPDREGSADRRDPGRAVRGHQAARSTSRSTWPASAGPRRGSRSRSTSSRSCAATSTAGSRWRRRARSSSTATCSRSAA